MPSHASSLTLFLSVCLTWRALQVAIFDYDVHHGNGTHDIFYNDPDLLFISTHQQGSYPGTGKLTETGGTDAQGATINIPLPGQFALCLVLVHMGLKPCDHKPCVHLHKV